jgi:hypothetical protein
MSRDLMPLITANELETNPKYRILSLKDLTYLLDNKMSFAEYRKIKGFLAECKAKNLKLKWKKLKSNNNNH